MGTATANATVVHAGKRFFIKILDFQTATWLPAGLPPVSAYF
jgi:hypothetical protein